MNRYLKAYILLLILVLAARNNVRIDVFRNRQLTPLLDKKIQIYGQILQRTDANFALERLKDLLETRCLESSKPFFLCFYNPLRLIYPITSAIEENEFAMKILPIDLDMLDIHIDIVKSNPWYWYIFTDYGEVELSSYASSYGQTSGQLQ